MLNAILTPIVGFVLLRILKYNFPHFYMTIYSRTVVIILIKALAFCARGIFNLFRFQYSDELKEWYASSVADDTWGASFYALL